MKLTETVRKKLNAMIGKERHFKNRNRAAQACGIAPKNFNDFLDGKKSISLDSFGKIASGVGVQILFPDESAPTPSSVPETSPAKEIAEIKEQLKEIGSSKEFIEKAVLKYLDSLNRTTPSQEKTYPAANE